MGGKRHYSEIVPLCPDHHRELHNPGRLTFEHRHQIDLDAEAEKTEQAWQNT